MAEYKKNYLNQVIFQLNFTPLDSLKLNIETSFSNLCKEQTGAEKVTLNTNQTVFFLPNQQISTEQTPIWNFIGNNVKITVQNGIIQVVAIRYTNHEIFHAVINKVIRLFSEKYTPKITRLAIRYINNISFPTGETFDFDSYINSNLLKATNEYKDFGLTRSIGNMFIKDDVSDFSTNFIYGYANSEFPNKITKREFLLDYDCFKVINEDNISVIDIIEKMRKYVNGIFEKSITENLRTEMNTQTN